LRGNDNGAMKIISGGQTGVDRAALDAAIEMGVPYGGWCPKGGWAEDMPHVPGLLALYDGLRETPLFSPRQRTKWNIRDADRLMVLVDSAGVKVSHGTEAARDLADRLDRPHIVLDLERKRDFGAGARLARRGGARDEPLHRRPA
jgi:hypothetical protein